MTVDPREDLVHAPDPSRERWRESWYFKFWDFRHGIGGDSTIGYRPSRGHSGALNVLWGLDLPTLVASEYDHAPDHAKPHPVAGLAYEMEEPFGAWRLRFEGRLNLGGADVAPDPRAVAPAGEVDGVEAIEAAYDLRFVPDAPAYRYRENPAWDGLFDGHVDEVGRVIGTVRVGDRTWQIDGRGCKDHSWGVRDWARPHGWRWADLLVPDGGTELSLWRSTFDGEGWLQDGALYGAAGASGSPAPRGVAGAGSAIADPLVSFVEEVTYAPRPRAPRPATWTFAAAGAASRLAGRAEILRAVPLAFPIRDEHGSSRTAWIDRCLYRAALDDGREAIGTVEFMRRV